MKCISLIVVLGLMFALPSQAADEPQPQGSQKEVKRPAEEGKAAAGGKDASGENKKKKEGEKQEGGSSEPGCD